MVNGDHLILNIHAGSQLAGTTDQDTDFSLAGYAQTVPAAVLQKWRREQRLSPIPARPLPAAHFLFHHIH